MIKNIIDKIVYLARQREEFVLATIFKSSGSTPRIEGASMIISQYGEIFGTIGGGLLEAKVIKRALEIKKKKHKLYTMNITLSSEESGGMGMICGGQLSVVLDPIPAGEETEKFFSSCLNTIKQGYECNFITIYNMNTKGESKEKKHYLTYGETILSDSNAPNKKELTLIKRCSSIHSDFNVINLNNNLIVCSSIFIPKLYIVGAGHVAQPTAIIAKMVKFNVTVMDDRESFANPERFPNVDAIKIVDFHDIFHNITLGKDSFIVIITRGHIYDSVVLEQAMLIGASYIGMIGSLKKRNSIFEELKRKGFKKKDIANIHSPIGIDIGSETPEEIALSIVSEMVLVRSGGPKRQIERE